MKKGLMIVWVCCFLMGFSQQAQAWPWSKGIIKGTVTDEGTSQPISGVKVTLEQAGQDVRSDEFGEFKFTEIPTDAYTLTVKKMGYRSQTVDIKVTSNKTSQVKIELQGLYSVYNQRLWTEKAVARISEIMAKRGYHKKRIAIAFYKRSGGNSCELPDVILKFATEFNKITREGNIVVIRDRKQAGYLISELKSQHQFRVDFDPATVARIGRKLGADVVIIGELLESKDYYEPQINVTSKLKQEKRRKV
jgi:hypothetical protein